MKAGIFSAINEFKKTQKTFATELQKFKLQFNTGVKPGMLWVGFEGESQADFIKKLQTLATGIQDLNLSLWILNRDEAGELVEVLNQDGSAVTERDVENYITDLSKSFCKGDLSRQLEILKQLTTSHLYYDTFLKKYLYESNDISLKTTLPFQRLTRFPLLLGEIKKNTSANTQKKCQQALEVVNRCIAAANQTLTDQIVKAKQTRQLDLERIEIRAKLTELNKTIYTISHKRRGIFRDRLKVPMRNLITEVNDLLVAELKKAGTTNYAATIQASLEILQGLARHQGSGAQLREIGLPIISEILKSIRPLPPYQSRVAKQPKLTKPSNVVPANSAQDCPHNSESAFFNSRPQPLPENDSTERLEP